MPFILPSEAYYDAGPHVAVGSIECAVRPDNYVLAEGWQAAPMNPAVCWRVKTAGEIEAEKDDKAVEFSDIKKAFAATLEILYENPDLAASFATVGGFKTAVKDRLKSKL